MRKIKANLAGFILFVLIASGSFITCEIGLGNSVDTKPPTVSISYPPVDSVIKNTFTLRGAANDETSLKEVSVVFNNIKTSAVYGPFPAAIDTTTKSWQLFANKKTTVYEIPDGSYEAKVTAVDSAGRTSLATTTYKIDNTAPVLVLQRPGTVGPLTLNPNNAEVYGAELFVVGQVADSNAVSQLVFTAYKHDRTSILGTKTVPNIASNINISLGSFSDAVDIDPLNLYSKLYGINKLADTKQYYATVSVSDEAQEYTPPTEIASLTSLIGNTSEGYYLYDDIYKEVLANFKITDLQAMFNGTYVEKTPGETTPVLEYLSLHKISTTTLADTSGTFSLNPESSPTYSVFGYSALPDPIAISEINNVIANQTAIAVKISAGRGGEVPLLPDTFKIYLEPCSSSGELTAEDDDSLLLENIISLGTNQTEIEIRNGKLSKSGSDYTVSLNIGSLVVNKNYLLVVEGYDDAGNPVDTKTHYGFYVKSNGTPPEIKFATDPVDLLTQKNVGFTYTGTITTQVPRQSLTATISVVNTATSTPLIIPDVTDKLQDPEVTGSPASATWTLSIPQLPPATPFGFYRYTCVFTGKDTDGNTTSVTRRIDIDNQIPTIEVTSILPTVTVGLNEFVNAKIDIKGRFADNDKIASGTYALNGGTPVSISNLTSWTISEIDTSLYDDASGLGNLPLVITVTDFAGNSATLSPVIKINQSTDTPTVSFTNITAGSTPILNMLGKTSNNKILGVFADDDGLKSISVCIDGITSIYLSEAVLNNTTSKSFSYLVSSLSEGSHLISFIITDKNGLVVTTDNVAFGIDDADPVIGINSVQSAYKASGETISVVGTALDSNAFTSIVDVTTSDSVTLTSGNLTDKTIIEWSYSFTGATETGTHTRSFRATDTFGKMTNVVFTYKVDNADPILSDIVPPSSDYVNLPDNAFYRITGKASDTGGSGLSQIQYAVTAGENSSAPAIGDAAWLTAGGLANWTANIDMSGKIEGSYQIHVIARDLAGKHTTPIYTRTIYADTGKPSIGTDFIPLAASIYHESFDLTGTATDTLGLQEVTASYTIGGTTIVLTNDGTFASWKFAIPVTTGFSVDGTYQITITAKDLSGKTTNSSYSFIRDTTAPVISLSNISTLGNTKLIDSSPKVIGLITDGTGIQGRTVLFEKKYGTVYAAPSGHSTAQEIADVTIGSTMASFSLDLATYLGADLTDGIWRVTIVSTDGALLTANERTFISADFRIDGTDPSVAITTPSSSGTFVKLNDNLTVSGTASDVGGFDYVRVQLLLGSTVKATANIPISSFNGVATPKNEWTCSFSAPFNEGGDYVIVATAYDRAGRIKEATRDISCDTIVPIISFTSPYTPPAAQGDDLAGTITLSGKSTDGAMRNSYYNIGGTRVGNVVTNGAGWTEFANSYNWNASFNSMTYATNPYATLIAGSRWTLPVHIKAVDMAGNISYSTIDIIIDTDIDKPGVTITSPTDLSTLGGSFRVSGGAIDNNFVYKLYMQVEVKDAVYETVGDYKTLKGFPGVTTTGGKNANGDADTAYFSRVSATNNTAWYEIEGTYSWGFTLNKNSEFYKSAIEALAGQVALPGTASQIIIRVKALDTKNSDDTLSVDAKFGLPQEITITLNENIPAIEEVSLPKQDYYFSGTIPLKFNISDDVGIDTLTVTANGVPLTIPSGDITKTEPNGGYYKKWSISTNYVTAGAGAVSLRIAVKEYQTENPTTSFFDRRFNVDNNAPSAAIISSPYYIASGGRSGANLIVSGYDAVISGKGVDADSGIKQAIIFFTQGSGAGMKIYTMGGTTAVGTGMDTMGTPMTTTYNFGTVATPNTKPFPVTDPSLISTVKNGALTQKYIVIDTLENNNDSVEPGDGDGYNENLRADGSWSINLNSYLVSDGLYTIHYVLIDKAGKASYNSDTMLVQNHKPVITGVVLYTDLKGDGIDETADTTNIDCKSFAPSGFAATSFTVRNNLLKIKVTATVVNTPAVYWLTYPNASGVPTSIFSSDGIFTVPSFPTDGTANGTSYTVWVLDAITPTPLSSGESTINLTLDNTDGSNPTGTLKELNTLVEASKIANVSGGSLYSVTDALTTKEVKQGHIETRSISLYDNGGGVSTVDQDPDVSGTIILRGTAFDDQRINAITLLLNNVSTPVATWNSTNKQMEAVAGGNAAVQSQSIVLTGHTVTWSYAWDTSAITGVAGANKPIVLQVTDATGNVITAVPYAIGNANACTSMNVDVVPYISNIVTPLSSGYSSAPTILSRSALGVYPIVEGDTINVYGFNLAAGADALWINKTTASGSFQTGKRYRIASGTGFTSIGAANNTVGTLFTASGAGTAGQGTAYPVMASVAQTGYWDVVPHSSSGPLEFVVNTVRSINNINGTTGDSITAGADWNNENNGMNNALLTDNREVALWSRTTVATNKTIRNPAMKISPNATQRVGWAYNLGENFFYMSQTTGGGNPVQFESNPTRYYATAFAFDAGGNTYGIGSGGDVTAGAGGISMWSSVGFFAAQPGVADSYRGAYDNNVYKNRIIKVTSDATAANTNSDRVQSPDLFVRIPTPGSALNDTTNKATGYFAYYDAIRNLVRLRVGGIGKNTANTDITMDGGFADHALADGSAGTNFGETSGTNANGSTIATATSIKGKSGAYVAVGVTTHATPVVCVAWYDETNRKLMFSYTTTPTTETEANWQSRAILIDSDFAGQYVDMAIDAGNGIHLAYYSSRNGDLRYSYLTSYSDTVPDKSTVDSYFSVGANLSITTKLVVVDLVDTYVPQIAYSFITFQGTSNSLKYAYQVASTVKDGAISDKFTKDWECMVVPTVYSPKDYTIGIGLKDFNGITNQPLLGYVTSDTLEYSQLR